MNRIVIIIYYYYISNNIKAKMEQYEGSHNGLEILAAGECADIQQEEDFNPGDQPFVGMMDDLRAFEALADMRGVSKNFHARTSHHQTPVEWLVTEQLDTSVLRSQALEVPTEHTRLETEVAGGPDRSQVISVAQYVKNLGARSNSTKSKNGSACISSKIKSSKGYNGQSRVPNKWHQCKVDSFQRKDQATQGVQNLLQAQVFSPNASKRQLRSNGSIGQQNPIAWKRLSAPGLKLRKTEPVSPLRKGLSQQKSSFGVQTTDEELRLERLKKVRAGVESENSQAKKAGKPQDKPFVPEQLKIKVRPSELDTQSRNRMRRKLRLAQIMEQQRTQVKPEEIIVGQMTEKQMNPSPTMLRSSFITQICNQPKTTKAKLPQVQVSDQDSKIFFTDHPKINLRPVKQNRSMSAIKGTSQEQRQSPECNSKNLLLSDLGSRDRPILPVGLQSKDVKTPNLNNLRSQGLCVSYDLRNLSQSLLKEQSTYTEPKFHYKESSSVTSKQQTTINTFNKTKFKQNMKKIKNAYNPKQLLPPQVRKHDSSTKYTVKTLSKERCSMPAQTTSMSNERGQPASQQKKIELKEFRASIDNVTNFINQAGMTDDLQCSRIVAQLQVLKQHMLQKKRTETNMTEESVTQQIEAANASNGLIQLNFTEHILSDEQSRNCTHETPREQNDQRLESQPENQTPELLQKNLSRFLEGAIESQNTLDMFGSHSSSEIRQEENHQPEIKAEQPKLGLKQPTSKIIYKAEEHTFAEPDSKKVNVQKYDRADRIVAEHLKKSIKLHQRASISSPVSPRKSFPEIDLALYNQESYNNERLLGHFNEFQLVRTSTQVMPEAQQMKSLPKINIQERLSSLQSESESSSDDSSSSMPVVTPISIQKKERISWLEISSTNKKRSQSFRVWSELKIQRNNHEEYFVAQVQKYSGKAPRIPNLQPVKQHADAQSILATWGAIDQRGRCTRQHPNFEIDAKMTQQMKELDFQYHDQNLIYTYNSRFKQKMNLKESQVLSAPVLKLINKAKSEGDASLQLKQLLSQETRLLSSFHINFKKIRNAHYSAIMNRKEMLLQGIEQEYFFQKPLLLCRSIGKRCEDDCKEAQLTVIHQFQIVEREEALMQQISFCKIFEVQEYEVQRQMEITKMINIFDKELRFYNYRNGQNNYNEPWLIRIINSNTLDNLIEPILINSLKAKTDVEGVTNLIDWRHIHENGQRFQGKYQISKDEFGAKFDKAFHKFQTRWRMRLLILNDDGKYTAASTQNISEMSGQWIKPILRLPMTLKYKLTFCQNHVLKMIQDHFYSDRRFYEMRSILTLSNSANLLNWKEQRTINSTITKKKVVIGFHDHWVYQRISNQNYFRMSQVVFSNQKGSIYKQLHMVENTETVFALITQVCSVANFKYRFLPFRSQGAYERLFGASNRLLYDLPLKRAKTLRSLPALELSRHSKLSTQIVGKSDLIFEYRQVNSEIGTLDKDLKVKENRCFKRQDTQNFYDGQYCDFLVHEILQKNKEIVKTSQVLYYMDLLCWVKNSSLKEEFQRHYGFKTKLARDLDHPTMIMEILKPTQIQKAKKKVQKYKLKAKQVVIHPDSMPVLERLRQHELICQHPASQSVSKEMTYLQPVDFDTDQSMKEVNYEEVKSDTSSLNLEDLKEKSIEGIIHKQNKRKILKKESIRTPFEYYQLFKPKRKPRRQKLKVFDSIKGEDFLNQEPACHKEQCHTTTQIELLMVDTMGQVRRDNIEQATRDQRQGDYIRQLIFKSAEAGSCDESVYKSPKSQKSPRNSRNRLSGSIKRKRTRDNRFSQIVKSRVLGMSKDEFDEISLKESAPHPNRFQAIKLVKAFKQAKTIQKENKLRENNELDLYQYVKEQRHQRIMQMNKTGKRRLSLLLNMHNLTSHAQHCERMHGNTLQKLRSHKLAKKIKYVEDQFYHQFQELQQPNSLLPQQSLEIGFDPETRDEIVRQFLIQSLSFNTYRIDEMLKRYYIPLETITTSNGDSLLILASLVGDEQQVKYLLNQGINPSIPNNDGNTPLHFALNRKHFKVADLLIHHGADESHKNHHGETPWEVFKR